jgi:ABC-type nitrate/sulfonate/bicarbonate transport system substrate-binding protein
VQIKPVVVLAAKIERKESAMKSFARTFLVCLFFALLAALPIAAHAAGPLLIAYGGHNETMLPIWVGIEKGLFRRHGVDPRALQTRSGPIMMATLASGGAALVWAAPGSAISTSTGGMKLTCFAAGNNAMPRELIVRKGIESIEDLRGKTFGVQSIGGGFWLSTMVALDALGLDPDKHKLNMRVIGDTTTVTQALMSGNVDAAVIPYSFADMAKRAGARALADAGAQKVVYQGTVFCAQKEANTVTSDLMIQLTKGLVESLVYILDPARKRDVMEVLKKNLRLSKGEDMEASYKVARLQMPNLDIAPNLDAWKTYRRIIARVNPKVQEADLEQIITGSIVQSLEASGFLPEMRKKLPR